jgi:hypothetical protein
VGRRNRRRRLLEPVRSAGPGRLGPAVLACRDICPARLRLAYPLHLEGRSCLKVFWHLAQFAPDCFARTPDAAQTLPGPTLQCFSKVVVPMFGLFTSTAFLSGASAFRSGDVGRIRTRPDRNSYRGRLGLGFSLALASLLTLVFAGPAVAAQPRVGLGTAGSFAVLAGSEITNTGPSVINGDLGVSPGTAISGFPPGTVNGAVHATNGVAGQAKSDLTTAYNDAAGRTPVVSVSGDLGGRQLTSGVYKASSSLGLTGAVTLDAKGDPDAVFIFQVGSALTTATDSSVSLLNGAQACNVYWQIGSSATLGTRTAFKGTILALTSISLNDGVAVQGRLLARNGAVTLINDTVTRPQCAAGTRGGSGEGTGNGRGDRTGRRQGLRGDSAGPLVRIFRLPGVGQPPIRRPGARRPPASTVCTTRNFTARVALRDGAGIRTVKVYLDGKLVRQTSLRRFSLGIKVRGLSVGPHRITVVARDRAGNRSVTTRRFGRCALALPAPRFTG